MEAMDKYIVGGLGSVGLPLHLRTFFGTCVMFRSCCGECITAIVIMGLCIQTPTHGLMIISCSETSGLEEAHISGK